MGVEGGGRGHGVEEGLPALHAKRLAGREDALRRRCGVALRVGDEEGVAHRELHPQRERRRVALLQERVSQDLLE